MVASSHDMGAATKSYFQNIFSADYTLEPSAVIDLVQSHVTDEMNYSLRADFTNQEIADALL